MACALYSNSLYDNLHIKGASTMRSLLRQIGLIGLIALFMNGIPLFAQENITVVGSGIVAPIIEAAAETSAANVGVSVTGTDRGFDTFCRNQADLTLATRPLSTDEDFSCTSAGVEFLELLAGYNAIAFVSSPDAQFNQCLTSVELRTLFAPSAQGQVTDWSQVNAENAPTPITLIVPPDDTAVYAALDSLVEGDGIRSDVQVLRGEDAISAVSANPNAIGIVSATVANAAGDAVRILELNTGAAGCTAPSLESIEGREYSGANRLLVYVNAASLDKPGMLDLLNAAFSEEARSIVEGLGFVAPSDETYATDQQVIAEVQTGRRFTRDVDEFVIPTGVFGALTIGGSAIAHGYMQDLTSAFTAQQPNVTIEQTYLGEPDGFRRLCNGELDMVVAFSDLTSEQAENCAANNVTPFPLELGSLAVVVLASTDSDFLTCLTTEQLATVWSASSAGTITNWNQVSPDFPETPITLLAPQPGSPYTDLMMLSVTGSPMPSRMDIQLDDDVAYRAAATANVEGSLTYMSWLEYQTIQESEQANISSVAVDSGSGCVEPTESTIADGTYPLTRPVRLIVQRSALARPEVQALLWFIFSDENYSLIVAAGLVGLDFADLPDVRFMLQDTFTQVQAEAAAITPETTPEATPAVEATDVTETPTETATQESTEAAEAPTEENTPEATEAGE
jgi:phosphate transport system substrate-binding protein